MALARDRSASGDSLAGGVDELSPSSVREWLAKTHPKQLALLDRFEMELRLGRLSTSSTAGARGAASALGSADPNSDVTAAALSSSSSSSSAAVTGGTSGRDRRLVTVRTLELLRTIIGATRWKTGAQLMALLRGLGRELQAAGGYREPAIGNVVRRVMCAVRDEVMAGDAQQTGGEGQGKKGGDMGAIDELSDSFAALKGPGATGGAAPAAGGKLSLSSMLWAHPQHVVSNKQSARHGGHARSGSHGASDSARTLLSADSFASASASVGGGGAAADDDQIMYPPVFYASRPDLRQTIMEAIQEIMSDLEDLHKNINDQATSHIHAGEVVLTYARSKTIELFLKSAAKKRKFQVVVCEGAPHYGGHAMAKSLAEAGIDTIVMNDATTFAAMARVNKVLLPAHAVLANGGLIAPSGSHMVALAAKHNSVPVVTITGMFKLCPMYPHEGQDTLNDLVSPSSVVDYAEMSDKTIADVEFINPVHDYIPPQLVNLFITNIGAFQPSYIYRLLAEYYHADDWESFE